MAESGKVDESLIQLAESVKGQAGQELSRALSGEETVTKYRKRFEILKAIRKPMEAKWQQVRDLLDPASSRWLGGNDDSDDAVIDDSQILDTLPRKMAQTAADGLHGGLSNPAIKWFSFYKGTYTKEGSQISREALEWLKNGEECVRDVLANTNFYMALHSVYREDVMFGCALMFIASDAEKLVRVYNYTVGSFWVAQNSNRVVDTAYVKSRLSAYDIVETYGIDRCPDVVKQALESGESGAMFTLISCVQPWGFFGDVAPSSEFGFEDVRFIEEGGEDDPILYRSGYRTKPFVFARWSESWDYVYPRSCPGIDALPDIRQLYKATESYTLAVDWTSDPAFLYDSAYEREIRGVRPGDLIAVTNLVAKVPVTPLIPPAFDFASNIKFRADLIERISNIFYNREIMMITARAEQNHEMTALEASLLNQEKSAVIGPITTRTGYDILIPSLQRSFDIIRFEWKILDEPPPELYGVPLEPYFTSDMAVTQRQAWMNRTNEVLLFLQSAISITQDTSIADPIDFGKWLGEFVTTDMLPPNIMRSDAEIKAIRDSRMQQAQQAGQLESMVQMGKAGKDLGQTPTTGDNAAAELIGSGGGLIGG